MEFLKIDEDGNITCFHDSEYAKKLKPVEIKRVSHITPKNPVLKLLFKTLRFLFGDESSVAEWTRHWNCEWEIKLILPTFKNRHEAIEYEKKIISILETYCGGDENE